MTTLLEEPISTVGPVSAKTKFPSNLSWDEFLALPQETRNAALIDGEVIVNPPNRAHEVVVKRLIVAFDKWISAGTDRGEVCTQQPVKIHDRRGYQPDIAWYSEAQCPTDVNEPFIGVPGLVAEVFSPSTRRFDVAHKHGDYEQVGVGELWFLDPVSRSALICQRAEQSAPFMADELVAEDTLTSPLLSDFSVVVGELFRR